MTANSIMSVKSFLSTLIPACRLCLHSFNHINVTWVARSFGVIEAIKHRKITFCVCACSNLVFINTNCMTATHREGMHGNIVFVLLLIADFGRSLYFTLPPSSPGRLHMHTHIHSSNPDKKRDQNP